MKCEGFYNFIGFRFLQVLTPFLSADLRTQYNDLTPSECPGHVQSGGRLQLFSVDQPFTIFSGGQTGVDRAALDVALELGIPCSGWCPRGRRAEDGTIPPRYPLQETRSLAYPVRTRWNVRDSDGTLILTRGRPDRGTALTI